MWEIVGAVIFLYIIGFGLVALCKLAAFFFPAVCGGKPKHLGHTNEP